MQREPREIWVKRVERWQDSSLSAKEFAAELGISHHTLEHWRYRLAREQSAGGRANGSAGLTPKRYTARERADIVAAFRRSGLTRQAFCDRRGVNVGTLSCWLHKTRGQKPKQAEAGNNKRRTSRRSTKKIRGAGRTMDKRALNFVEVVGPPAADSRIEIELKSGTRLRLPPTFDVNVLGSLVQTLEARP